MREIKFRAWDNGKMRYDVWPTSNNTIGAWLDNGRELQFHDLGGSKVILMQFTGLKDKNGKEIYEGDMIKGYRTGKIIWNEKLSSFGAVNKEGQLIYDFPLSNYTPEPEVIGNIHDNPELLEREDD